MHERESDLSALLRVRGALQQHALQVWAVDPREPNPWRARLSLVMPHWVYQGVGDTPDEAIADVLRRAGVEAPDA